MGNKHSASSSSRNDNNDHLQQQRIKSKYSVIEPDDSIKVRQMFSYDRQSFELKPLEISGPFYEDSLNRLMVIPNFFSDDECRDLIKKCSNFQSLEDEYPKEHRNAMRELVTDNKLADLIFNRLKNKIDLDQIGKSIAPYGLDSRGRWVACGVNECMRFSKYEKGEYFKIHTDGQFRRSENERSIYTLLIYLNQDFNGGETKFFSDPNDDTFNLHHTLKPSIGKLALFNQDFYHEGCSVISGIKYILRTEIMYLRVDNNSIPRDNNFEQSETYQQIGQAFKESETLEKSGDVYGSSEKYFAGQRLLVKSGKTFEYLLNRQYCILEGPVENDKNDNLTVLPEEIILNIFTFLSESEICSVGLQLSRYLNHLARSPILWKAVYKKYWNGNTYLKLCEKEPLTDWYHAARVRNFTERNFKPICIDITSEVATFGFFSDETPKTTEPYVGRYTGGHYNFYSYSDAMLGRRGSDQRNVFDYLTAEDYRVTAMNVGTFFSKVCEEINFTPSHPLLISIPPKYLKMKKLSNFIDLVLKTQVPAVCLLSRHTMIAYYHSISHCIVIEKDVNTITISVVLNFFSFAGDIYEVDSNRTIEKEFKKGLKEVLRAKRMDVIEQVKNVILVGSESGWAEEVSKILPNVTIVHSTDSNEGFRGAQMFATQEDFRDLCSFWNGQIRDYHDYY